MRESQTERAHARPEEMLNGWVAHTRRGRSMKAAPGWRRQNHPPEDSESKKGAADPIPACHGAGIDRYAGAR